MEIHGFLLGSCDHRESLIRWRMRCNLWGHDHRTPLLSAPGKKPHELLLLLSAPDPGNVYISGKDGNGEGAKRGDGGGSEAPNLAQFNLVQYSLSTYQEPGLVQSAKIQNMTSYIICGLQCKMKMLDPCSKMIKNFKMVTIEH